MQTGEPVFLSFVITTYKRSEWLAECLASIMQSVSVYQADGGDKKMEIVVCDDDPQQAGFPIGEWTTKFAGVNVDFRYNINKNNLGDYFNRNEGIRLSKGKWVKFIDDDDLIYDWSVSFMIDKLLISEGANTVVFYLRDNFRHLKFPVTLHDKEILEFHYLKYGLFHCSLVSAAFLRSDLVRKSGFKFKRFYGDFQIFHEMAEDGCFYIYPIELGWYRMHEAQESNNNRQMVRIRFNYLMYSFEYFLRSGNTDQRYLDVLIKDSFAYIRHATKRMDFALLKRALRLRKIMQGYRNNKNGFNMDNWKAFYTSELSFNNNVHGALAA